MVVGECCLLVLCAVMLVVGCWLLCVVNWCVLRGVCCSCVVCSVLLFVVWCLLLGVRFAVCVICCLLSVVRCLLVWCVLVGDDRCVLFVGC